MISYAHYFIRNTGSGLWIGLRHEDAPNGVVFGDVRVVLKIHASVQGIEI